MIDVLKCWECGKSNVDNFDEDTFFFCDISCKNQYEEKQKEKRMKELEKERELEEEYTRRTIQRTTKKLASAPSPSPSPIMPSLERQKGTFKGKEPKKKKPYTGFIKQEKYKCPHQFPCSAHRKICEEQYGIVKFGGVYNGAKVE